MITDYKDVSVVIPLYNKAPHIAKAIESVLQQTVPAREIIVVDDGSTDGSADIARAVEDERVNVITQPNRGVSAARNRGIEIAASELIAFLDADDEWHPNFLECVTELAKAYPSAGAYSTAFQFRSDDGTIIKKNYALVPTQPGLIEDYFHAACIELPVCSSSVMIPKQIFSDVGGFPEGVVIGEDLDTWMRIALKYKIAWTPSVCATIYLDESNGASHVLYQGELPFAATLDNWKKDHGSGESLYYQTEFVNHWYLRCARSNWLTGRTDAAKDLLNKARGTVLFRRIWIRWRLITMFPQSWSVPLWRWKQRLSGKGVYSRPVHSVYRSDTTNEK